MGPLYPLLSGAAFGLLPWFGRVAFDHGAEPVGLLAVRFAVAATALLAAAPLAMRRAAWPSARAARRCFLLGAVGYAPQSLFFFLGVERIDIGLATVIFYTYPAMVVVVAWLAHKHRPTPVMVACLVLATGGAALSAGTLGSGTAVGVAFMAMAALWYTGYIFKVADATSSGSMYASVVWIMIGSTFSLGTAAAVTGSSLPADATGWTAAMAAAIVSTAAAVGLFLLGVRTVGPGHAAVLSTIEPVVTIVVGVAALDERLGRGRIIGAILVIGAVLVLAARSGEARAEPTAVGASA